MSIILPRDEINNTLESVDRISALPDSILGVILSLLPTKNVVATSTLSKRWEFMWRTVHNLDFCFEFQGDTDEQHDDENKKFVGFVNHVLLHHDSGVLNKFRLLWTLDCIESHVISWIKTAITRNVHELSLTLGSYDGPFDMPISVFSCDSLRSLQLDGWICLSAATVFCLPRLETLDLIGVHFQSDEAFEKIIRGCPVLNYLHIDMDDDDDDSRFIISSTSLRRLELKGRCYKYLKLEASSLEHLKLYGSISVNFVQKKFSSLVEADLGIYLAYDFSQAGICDSVVDALSALDSAKILTLSSNVMRVLSCATVNLSTEFKNLVKLETTAYCCHWSSLRDFIQSSNNLEVLTIHKFLKRPDDGNNHDHSNWTTPVEVPRCLSTSLKKVVLDGYYGYEDEREMIHYMLKHGSALQVMQISCDEDKIELLQEIREFPRKSPACKCQILRVDMKEQRSRRCNHPAMAYDMKYSYRFDLLMIWTRLGCKEFPSINNFLQ